MQITRIAVTGANGFVGRALVERIASESGRAEAIALVRAGRRMDVKDATQRVVGDRSANTDWSHALCGVDVLVDCAARVHVLREHRADALAEYRRVNVEGTRHLAEAAAVAGVRRLVYVSSVKVNGERTTRGQPFAAADQPSPQDYYGQSKLEAELALRDVARRTGMEFVVVRPPLVYGPGVGANFRRLIRLVSSGWPLPLGAVDNRRSMVALDNLVDLLLVCAEHPAAAGNTFMASDGQDQSTRDLIKTLAAALGRKPRLFAVPQALLHLVGTVTGRRAEIERLTGDLQVDIEATRRQLGWHPPVAMESALRDVVARP